MHAKPLTNDLAPGWSERMVGACSPNKLLLNKKIWHLIDQLVRLGYVSCNSPIVLVMTWSNLIGLHALLAAACMILYCIPPK